MRGRKSSAPDVALVFPKWSNFVPSSVAGVAGKALGGMGDRRRREGGGVENKAVVDLPFREGRSGGRGPNTFTLLAVCLDFADNYFLTTKAYLVQKNVSKKGNSFKPFFSDV